ncbi:MAG: hypothetical protein Q8Q31_01255 [Nanoarchaeota archaeon]|nr:hypothetical protein [Nanoarchaeota archaeon]
MRNKNRTVEIRRAREAKVWRNYYFGAYLLLVEPARGMSTEREFNQGMTKNFN